MASNLGEKKLSLKLFSSLEEYLADDSTIKEEIIEIANFSEKDIKDAVKEGFFFMPNYITYIRETTDYDSLISSLSKTKRKKLRKIIASLKDFEITFEEPVSEETYVEWYKIHLENLAAKKIGLLTAKEDWYAEKSDKKLGIFLREKKSNRLLGGLVGKFFKKRGDEGRFSVSFSAMFSEYKKRGFNEYFNVLLIAELYKRGIKLISRGKDTNLYGKHLSPGIFTFKTSFGFETIPSKAEGNILVKFNSLDDFSDVIFFLSYFPGGGMEGNLILKKEIDNISEFNRTFLKRFNLYHYEKGKLKFVERLK